MMHDFVDGNHRSKQRDARADGARIVRELYRDMDPTRDDNQMPRKLTIDRAIDEVSIELSDGPAANDPLVQSAFERQGIVEGSVTNTAVGIDDFFPHNLFLGVRFADNPFAKMRQTLRFTDRYRLLADSWRLHDGQDVLPGDRDKAFTKQVDRLAWGVGGLSEALQSWPALSAGLSLMTGYDHNPFETVVASRNYTDGAASGRRQISSVVVKRTSIQRPCEPVMRMAMVRSTGRPLRRDRIVIWAARTEAGGAMLPLRFFAMAMVAGALSWRRPWFGQVG